MWPMSTGLPNPRQFGGPDQTSGLISFHWDAHVSANLTQWVGKRHKHTHTHGAFPLRGWTLAGNESGYGCGCGYVHCVLQLQVRVICVARLRWLHTQVPSGMSMCVCMSVRVRACVGLSAKRIMWSMDFNCCELHRQAREVEPFNLIKARAKSRPLNTLRMLTKSAEH